MDDTKWLIWSIQHDAWWRDNKHGYSESICDAGVYSYKEACEIISRANYRLTLERKEVFSKVYETPDEAMILLTPELQKIIKN